MALFLCLLWLCSLPYLFGYLARRPQGLGARLGPLAVQALALGALLYLWPNLP